MSRYARYHCHGPNNAVSLKAWFPFCRQFAKAITAISAILLLTSGSFPRNRQTLCRSNGKAKGRDEEGGRLVKQLHAVHMVEIYIKTPHTERHIDVPKDHSHIFVHDFEKQTAYDAQHT